MAMTVIGWIQIILYCAIIVAIVPVLGAYMTRVFNGERTVLSAAWDADGRCLSLTPEGPVFWDGQSWADGNFPQN